MEMETEDDVALGGSVGPRSSAVPSVMAQECQAETAEKVLERDESVALS
jgi:hypothetical protein